jgi:hypothetical protein
MVKVRCLLPLVLVSGLLALPASVSANPDVASISYTGSADLLFSPGPVNVTLHYSCPPPSPGEIFAVVVQDLVQGESLPTLATCDGHNHSITLTVTGLFVPGEAQGLAVVQNASADTSGVALANQRIMIK